MPPQATRPAPEDVQLVDVLVLMEGNAIVPWRKPWHPLLASIAHPSVALSGKG